MKYLILIPFLYLSLMVQISWSADSNYACKVKNVYELSFEGALVESIWQSEFRNSSFSVDRKTGRIEGKILPTSAATTTSVINTGSAENSFKATALLKDKIQLIEIQEFREAKSKPFIASSMSGAGLVTGLCK